MDLSGLSLAVGHATDPEGATGLTVVRGIEGHLRGGVAVFGRATGTRELDALAPTHLVDRIDAVLLTGGSAYGLAAAEGVTRWLEEHQRGFAVTGGVVPIVPAAVIFDLAPLGRFRARPTAEMAYAATEIASPVGIAEGSVGAGTGATVGKIAGPSWAMKGGFGCAAERADGLCVAAMVCVNALGDIVDERGTIVAGARRPDGLFLDSAATLAIAGGAPGTQGRALQNTTLAVIGCNANLSKVEHSMLARAAGAALFRRIVPAATLFDGDVVFSVGPPDGDLVSPDRRLQLEVLAVRALGRAIERAVKLARGRDGIPGLADGEPLESAQ